MPNKKLNLYFVLGGAVSAGAYTAGVIDYFMQILKEYDELPENKKEYDIEIKAIAGASAGGMCGAIFTNGIAKGWPYKPYHSTLFKTWVKEIDISKLTTTDDLKDKNVVSLLNGKELYNIADKAFVDTPYGNNLKPKYIADDFKLILSVTNTTGLSYAVEFANKDFEHPYFITNHRDYFNFSFHNTNQVDNIHLNTEKDWDCLKKAAVATGAFPIGLPPVMMERPVSIYKDRSKNTGMIPFNLGGETIAFCAIDGGVGDNEPLGVIQKLIEKNKNEKHVVVFIDPFPSERKENKKNNIMSHLGRLYSVFRNQSAYKPEEIKPFVLDYQNADSNATAFFIAPKRRLANAKDLQVAGGSFAAFGGFFHESYRYHDYTLGLRNCQRFLSTRFMFPDSNKLIMPGTFSPEIAPVSWPSLSKKEFKKIIKPLNKRIAKVLRLLLPLIFAPFSGILKPSKLIEKSLTKHRLIQ